MRFSFFGLSICVLSIAACGDDGGSSSESSDTSAGPSTGPDDSSSGGSIDSGSSGGSSGGATEDSGSTSGADSGSTGESGGSSESGETGGAAFPCGDELECDLATQYCQEQISDIGGEPNTYQCIALPDGCGGENSCDCLTDEPCGDFGLCEMTGEGGSILSCPGG